MKKFLGKIMINLKKKKEAKIKAFKLEENRKISEMYKKGTLFFSRGLLGSPVDYYLIMERKNDFLTLQKLKKEDIQNNINVNGWRISGYTRAILDFDGKPFRKKIKQTTIGLHETLITQIIKGELSYIYKMGEKNYYDYFIDN